MLFERKLSENELEQREAVIQGLLKNKRNLVKKYGKDAEKVMYGIATKKAKSKVESMNKEKIRELIYKALTKEDNDPSGENLEGDPGEHVEEGTCGYDRDIKGKKLKGPGGLSEDVDNFEVDNAIGELGDIIRDIDDKADEAREIVRQVFPNELSRLDAYGAFNMTYSNNRYDVTLGRFVERLEEEGYEIEDGEVYVNEDLDVGHVDDEPGMLKSELARAGKMVQMLYRAIDKYDGKGEVDFPQWWQKKIIQANSMLDSAFDYLDGKENVAKIDSVIKNVVKEKVVRKKLAKAPKADKVASKQKMKLPSGMVSYMDFAEQIYEKLTERKNEFAPGGKYFLPDDGYMAAKLRAEDGYYNPRGATETDASGDTPEDDAEFAIKNNMGVKDPEKIKKFIDGWMKYNQEVLDGTTKLVPYEPDPNRFFQKRRRSNPGKHNRYDKKTNALIQKLKAKRGVDEKLTKKSDVGDFVDDFKKSDAKQFKGKSDKKKKQMAVAAYLSKQND